MGATHTARDAQVPTESDSEFYSELKDLVQSLENSLKDLENQWKQLNKRLDNVLERDD